MEQQQGLFAEVEQPLTVLLPELDEGARRVLARTLFSAVHGIVGLGLEEKLVSLPLPDLRSQLAAAVRAIAAGRDELRSIDPTPPPGGPISAVLTNAAEETRSRLSPQDQIASSLRSSQ